MTTLPRLKTDSRTDDDLSSRAAPAQAHPVTRPRAERDLAPDLAQLEVERAQLDELIAADDPDPAHPLFARYKQYLERLEALTRERGLYALRQEADPAVPLADASKLPRMGQLSSDGGEPHAATYARCDASLSRPLGEAR